MIGSASFLMYCRAGQGSTCASGFDGAGADELLACERTLRSAGGRVYWADAVGVLAQFVTAHQALACAQTLADPPDHHALFDAVCLHAVSVDADQSSLPTEAIQLLVRLSEIADPGGIVTSASFRDYLSDGVDGGFRDLGPCQLKHVPEPVRAYVVEEVVAPTDWHGLQAADRPALVVLPFAANDAAPDIIPVGDLIAERVLARLSDSRHVHLISRLSGAALRHSADDVPLVRQRVRADYVLRGQYRKNSSMMASGLSVAAELVDARTGEVVWRDDIRAGLGDLLATDGDLAHRIATGAHHALLQSQLAYFDQAPINTLDNYALLLSGIALMHRCNGADFDRARLALEELAHRDERWVMAHAWLAKWYVLRVTRGLTQEPQKDAAVALDSARRAQTHRDTSSLAMAMEGFVQLHLKRDFDRAEVLTAQAVVSNQHESLAWLFQGVVKTFLDQPATAIQASKSALALSPLDPLLYYFESLAASSAIVAGDYALAEQWCRQSLRRNVLHLHTHRALVTALWAQGELEAARGAALQLLKVAPGYTVGSFSKVAASAGTRFGHMMEQALLASGLRA